MNYLVNSCSVMNNIKRNNDFYCYWLCKFQMKHYCVTVIGASPLGFAVSFGNARMRINNCINFVFFIGLENYHRYCAPVSDSDGRQRSSIDNCSNNIICFSGFRFPHDFHSYEPLLSER